MDMVKEAYTWLGTPHRNFAKIKGVGVDCGSRSREGAWIEIICAYNYAAFSLVAPVRECGLKH